MKLESLKEIHHPSHPNHGLKASYTDTPFTCDACREAGIGSKYTCTPCDFDLHRACAAAPPSLTHPFYPRCEFRLLARPPGHLSRVCDACRQSVTGLVYHCARCGFDLHPCCAALPHRLTDSDRRRFFLAAKVSSACHRCGVKGMGWSYRSECKSYTLHIACAKEMIAVMKMMAAGNGKGKISDDVDANGMMIPAVKGMIVENQQHRGGRGKVRRCCLIAGGALRAIVSAVLGDPSAIIAAVVLGFISK